MTRLKTIVALVIGTLLATALPAQAQTEYFTDSLNDLRYLADHTEVPAEVAYGTDIRRVKISFNTDRLRIVSRHVDLKASDSNDLVIWVLNVDGDDLPELTIAADETTFWQ